MENQEKSLLKDYTEFTRKTVAYPPEQCLTYLTLGLANEAGEVAGKYKKWIRGDYDFSTLKEKIAPELGDCFWYLVRLCDDLGFDPEDIIISNSLKLQKRLNENKIRGDGDDR